MGSGRGRLSPSREARFSVISTSKVWTRAIASIKRRKWTKSVSSRRGTGRCRHSFTPFHVSLDVAQGASTGSDALASARRSNHSACASDVGSGDPNLKQEDQVAATAKASRANAVVSRALYLVPKGYPALPPAPAEQPSKLETTPSECDALISVWWDQPPCETAQQQVSREAVRSSAP